MIKKESIIKGGVLTSLFNFLGKLLGFLSIFIITWTFGANDKTDIFYLLLSFSTLVVAVFSTLQTSVFLPLFIKIKTQSGDKRAWEFSNSFFTYSFLAGLLISFLFFLFPVSILKTISHIDAETLNQSKTIILYFAPIILLFNATEHLRAIINSLYHFSFPAFMILINNLIVVLFLAIFSKHLGPVTMSLSLVASYLFQFIWMLTYVNRKIPGFGISFKMVKEYGEFFKVGYPLIIAQILGSVSAYFFDYTATGFSHGTLTAISYANRIYSLPVEMIVLPIISVLMPFFSEQYAKKDETNLLHQYVKYNNLLWYIIIPISFIFVFFSDPIVEILLKRGLFTAEYAYISSISLKIFAINLFGISLVAINTKVLWALQKTFLPSLVSSVACILNILLVYFVSLKFGFIGIPLSRTISVVLFGIFPSIIFSIFYIKGFKIKSLILPLMYILFISATAAFISLMTYTFFIKFILTESNLLFNILSLSLSFIIFGVVYLLLSFIFKIKEFEMIKSAIIPRYSNVFSIMNRIKNK